MNTVLSYCLVALLAGGIASDRSPEARFAEAQAAFDAAREAQAQAEDDTVEAQRRFYGAAKQFAELAQGGVRSVNLYVNAGNAYHFAGDDPRALLWYLRANELSNTTETRNGLIAVRDVCGAEAWPHDPGSIGRALMFWHHDLSQPVKQRIFLAAFPLGCLLVVVAVLIRRRSVWLRLGLALMVVGATMGVSDLATSLNGGRPLAVVLEDGQGYAGNGEGYSIVLDHIRPGQEVKIIESRQDWTHVELPAGTTCWLRAEICEKV